jgi:hypothetical protein
MPVDEDVYEDVYEDIDEHLKPFKGRRIEEWITLAHVCRRWRSVVFQSPHRLNLRLVCTYRTSARDALDIWPPFPLIIIIHNLDTRRNIRIADNPSRVDNIIAGFEHNDRVSQIELRNLTSSELEHVIDSAAMRKPFPELTDLNVVMYQFQVRYDGPPGPILPDSFLGGSAPRLRSLRLSGCPFPGLPKLLLSATHLVHLSLDDIPRSAYIPPEVMATSLSALTSLEFLCLEFQYPRPRPALESRRPPPPPLTRSILPNLTKIRFKEVSEYLEEILARIDAPRLNQLQTNFFNEIIFDTPQLFQLISRTPTLMAPERCLIRFDESAIAVIFPSQTSDYAVLSVEIWTRSEWQLSSLEQVCTSSLPPVSTLQDLYIYGYMQDNIDNTLFLDPLRSFVAVKNLYLLEEFVTRIARALQELQVVGGRMTEFLPSLENMFLEGFQPSGPLHEGIERFVAARRLAGHPVAVSPLEREALDIMDRYD